MVSFKDKYQFKDRLFESTRIRNKYPERVPIIVERDNRSTDIPQIDKHKYLVPRELTVGQFVYVIRKRIKLAPEKAIFLFVNNKIPPTCSLLGNIDEQERDSDNFVYFLYSGENTFGDEFI